MCFDEAFDRMDRMLHFRAPIISFHFFSFIMRIALYFICFTLCETLQLFLLLLMITMDFGSNSKILDFLLLNTL